MPHSMTANKEKSFCYDDLSRIELSTIREIYADHNSGDKNNGGTKIWGFFLCPALNYCIFLNFGVQICGDLFQNFPNIPKFRSTLVCLVSYIEY